MGQVLCVCVCVCTSVIAFIFGYASTCICSGCVWCVLGRNWKERETVRACARMCCVHEISTYNRQEDRTDAGEGFELEDRFKNPKEAQCFKAVYSYVNV